MLGLRLALMILCLSLPCPLFGWEGTVIAVHDGDLLTALHEGKEERLRLFGVDTPDEPQEFGREAREFTSQWVLGRRVEVVPVAQDRHGNTVAIISVEGLILNRELAGSGLAWVYGLSCNRPECKEWKGMEVEARTRGLGIWSASNPTPPWDFRRSQGMVSPPSEVARTEEPQEATLIYHADIVSRLYHAPECPEYNCKNCLADFKGKSSAEQAGYKPCPVCNP